MNDPQKAEKLASAKAMGDTVRELRLAMGVSQEELGSMATLHRTYVGSCERGESHAGLLSLGRLAKALGVPLTELVRRYEERLSPADRSGSPASPDRPDR